MVLAIVSLVYVVRAVDQVTTNLQIGKEGSVKGEIKAKHITVEGTVEGEGVRLRFATGAVQHQLLLGIDALNFEESSRMAGGAPAPIEPFVWQWGNIWGSLGELRAWVLALGKPLAVGLVALASTLAALGYFAAKLGWRLYVVTAWRARAKRRRR